MHLAHSTRHRGGPGRSFNGPTTCTRPAGEGVFEVGRRVATRVLPSPVLFRRSWPSCKHHCRPISCTSKWRMPSTACGFAHHRKGFGQQLIKQLALPGRGFRLRQHLLKWQVLPRRRFVAVWGRFSSSSRLVSDTKG